MRSHAFYQQNSGSALVEFSLIGSIFLCMLLGFMDVCRAMYARIYIASAAHMAARYAATHGAEWPGNCTSAAEMSCKASNVEVASFVKTHAPPGISSADLSVSTSWPGTNASDNACNSLYGSNSSGCLVTVQVSYPISFFSPMLWANPPSLTAHAASTIAQ